MYYFKKIYELILSLILPKEKDVLEIEKTRLEDFINNIPPANEATDDNFQAIFQYRNKIARRAVWEIKYRGNKAIIQNFAKILYEFILTELSEKVVFDNFTNPIIIPIPLSKSGLHERGFNQCELLVREIVKLDKNKNFTPDFSALTKTKNTPHQSKLKNKTRRLKNLDGCFIADKEKVSGKCIILIDDVITTGATMNEASKTLKKAGAKKVIGFAIAH